MTKLALRITLALLMIAAGSAHLARPDPFVKIVPAYIPQPRAMVIVSGIFEILGGLGLLIPWSRSFAAWGLVALFVAVFPANVNMAMNKIPLGNFYSAPLAWARLPLQAVLIAWAWWLT